MKGKVKLKNAGDNVMTLTTTKAAHSHLDQIISSELQGLLPKKDLHANH
jgi:hypothetical protein